jgi:hypothetical protein
MMTLARKVENKTTKGAFKTNRIKSMLSREEAGLSPPRRCRSLSQ